MAGDQEDDHLAVALGAAMVAVIQRSVDQALTKAVTGHSEAPSLLDVPEVASRLGISQVKVKRLIAAGELRSVLLGRRRLVPSEAVADYIRSLEGEQLKLF
jgi:excisionase family DNA binding protein